MSDQAGIVDSNLGHPADFPLRTVGVLVDWLTIPIFYGTLVCSSAMLLLLEPMTAKRLLPLLGGSPAVWNTCMVYFQALMLGAYAFGHLTLRYLPSRRQILVQISLLLLAVFALPIGIPSSLHPPAQHNPTLWLLGVLTVSVGLPFFALATLAPVMQRWFTLTRHIAGKDPYFLYTASNIGSLAALVAYPIVLEPLLHMTALARYWSMAYIGLVVCCGCCCFFVRSEECDLSDNTKRIGLRRRIRWILLAAIPSSLLLGATTYVTSDIAAVPMLWIVPLILYLLSFILVFARRQLLCREMMMRLLPVCVLSIAFLTLAHAAQPLWLILTVHAGSLFICCMACHGELAADRPQAEQLTDFYLMIAVGGVIGGMFNALAAPLLFHRAVEYPLALVAAAAICWSRESTEGLLRSRIFVDMVWAMAVGVVAWKLPSLFSLENTGIISARVLAIGIPIMATAWAIKTPRRFVLSVVALFLVAGSGGNGGSTLLANRSFYGIYRIVRNSRMPFNEIYHGATLHGRQYVDPSTGLPSQADIPLAYYSRRGPIGQILSQTLRPNDGKRVWVIGMGVGDLAAYATKKTDLTFFELDPGMKQIAENGQYFSFVQAARQRGAAVSTVLGDARLRLRDMPDDSCDILVIDAFSGDAVPVHLLTREAMHLYLQKMDDKGVLVFHTSNIYLDLLSVCSALATDSNCVGIFQSDISVDASDVAEGKSASQWVAIARNRSNLGLFDRDPRWQPLPSPSQGVWTDDFSDVFRVFRWR